MPGSARSAPRYHLACRRSPLSNGETPPERSRLATALVGCDGPHPSGSTEDAEAIPFFRRLTGDGRVDACPTMISRLRPTAGLIRAGTRCQLVYR